MYSEAPIVVIFSCGCRIFAKFWMAAFALCSAIYFGVFHGAGCKNLHTLPVMPCRQNFFFVKITNCWFFFAVAFVLRFISCSYCSSMLVASSWSVLCSLCSLFFEHFVFFVLLHVTLPSNTWTATHQSLTIKHMESNPTVSYHQTHGQQPTSPLPSNTWPAT